MALLLGCATAQKPPPLSVSGGAFSLPAVGKTMPISLFLTANPDVPVSVKYDAIRGVAQSGAEVSAMTLDAAAEGAGGSDRLLAVLSDETEIAHVAKLAGLGFKGPTGLGIVIGCAPGVALIAAGSSADRNSAGLGVLVMVRDWPFVLQARRLVLRLV